MKGWGQAGMYVPPDLELLQHELERGLGVSLLHVHQHGATRAVLSKPASQHTRTDR